MARKDDIIGLRDLERSFRELGKVPQTVATQSARAGASVARRAAKANAPEDTGALKQAIIMKRERRSKRGKAVYDILIDPSKNDQFVKISRDGKRSYYPASQEYGFFTVDGRYIPGYGYLRRAVDDNKREIERAALKRATVAIDKAMRKK